ncbi:MAG: hypothetical protein AAGJ93_01235 [Bacteroidota bacterium]
MKLFLTKLLILVVPLMALLSLIEVNSRNNDRSSKAFQKKFLEEKLEELEGVVIGPSHSWRSIQPKYLDYTVASLAFSGSSPNVDQLIYEYVEERANPSFYLFDLSTMYLAKQNTNEWINAKKLPYYYPNIKTGNLSDYFLTRVPLRNYLFLKKRKSRYDRWGYNYEIQLPIDIFKQLNYQDSLIVNHPSVQGVLNQQLEEAKDNKTHLNIEIYKKIIQECRAKGTKIIFISPPKYHIYNENMEERFALERQQLLDKVVDNENVFFLNFEKKYEYEPTFFFDFNHLNVEGSKNFSLELNKSLKEIIGSK